MLHILHTEVGNRVNKLCMLLIMKRNRKTFVQCGELLRTH